MRQILINLFAILSAFLYSPYTVSAQHFFTVSTSPDTTLLDNNKLFPAFSDSILDKIASSAGIEKNKVESDAIKMRLKNNIAVIFLYVNDSLFLFQDSALPDIDYIPAISQAMFYNDTLHISAGVGFFRRYGSYYQPDKK